MHDPTRDFPPELASLLNGGSADRLDGIAVGIGPGSFTGVKIGVMAAKALAWSKRIPLVGIGSLDSVAASTPPPSGPETILLIAVPSTRGEAYIQAYKYDNEWVRFGEIHDVPLSPGCLESRFPDAPLIVSGEAADLLALNLDPKRNFVVADLESRYPSAHGILSLARSKFVNKQTDDPLMLTPDYIRLSQPDRLSDRGAEK